MIGNPQDRFLGFTIRDMELIAERASQTIRKEFRQYGWGKAPTITPGTVRNVMEAATALVSENRISDR